MVQMLQHMPWNVMAGILHHLMRTSQLRYVANQILTEKRGNQYAQLLYTCRAWRHMAQSQFSKHMRINVECTPPCLRQELVHWPTNVMAPDCGLHSMVQEVQLEVDFWSILNGNAIRLLADSSSGPRPLVLPAAHTLRMTFGQFELGYDDDVPDPTGRVLEFISQINAMMPKLCKIHVEHCIGYITGNDMVYRAFNLLIGHPFNSSQALRQRLLENNPPTVGRAINCVPAACLTSVSFVWNIYYRQTAQLIRANSQTLQTLVLIFNHHDGISQLIEDDDGLDPIVYPNLTELRFSCWYYLHPGTMPHTKNPGAFPSLRRMYLDMDYPFGDNTLFRGNDKTLELLSMNINAETIAMAQKHQVFRKDRLSNLRTVRLKNINNCLLRLGASSRKVADFALSVATHLQVLTVEDIAMENELAQAVANSTQLASLQLLAIPDATLTMTMMVDLLKALPMLGELRCQHSGLGSPIENVPSTELPDYFYTTYYPLNKNFCVLQLGHQSGNGLWEFAQCTMLLAIVCPEFTFAAVLNHLRSELDLAIVEAVSGGGPYSKYEARLMNLLTRD